MRFKPEAHPAGEAKQLRSWPAAQASYSRQRGTEYFVQSNGPL
jgi:hypothetical protein